MQVSQKNCVGTAYNYWNLQPETIPEKFTELLKSLEKADEKDKDTCLTDVLSFLYEFNEMHFKRDYEKTKVIHKLLKLTLSFPRLEVVKKLIAMPWCNYFDTIERYKLLMDYISYANQESNIGLLEIAVREFLKVFSSERSHIDAEYEWALKILDILLKLKETVNQENKEKLSGMVNHFIKYLALRNKRQLPKIRGDTCVQIVIRSKDISLIEKTFSLESPETLDTRKIPILKTALYAADFNVFLLVLNYLNDQTDLGLTDSFDVYRLMLQEGSLDSSWGPEKINLITMLQDYIVYISRDPLTPIYRSNQEGETFLSLAIIYGCLPMCRMLSPHCINNRMCGTNSILHLAAQCRQVHILSFLLEQLYEDECRTLLAQENEQGQTPMASMVNCFNPPKPDRYVSLYSTPKVTFEEAVYYWKDKLKYRSEFEINAVVYILVKYGASVAALADDQFQLIFCDHNWLSSVLKGPGLLEPAFDRDFEGHWIDTRPAWTKLMHMGKEGKYNTVKTFLDQLSPERLSKVFNCDAKDHPLLNLANYIPERRDSFEKHWSREWESTYQQVFEELKQLAALLITKEKTVDPVKARESVQALCDKFNRIRYDEKMRTQYVDKLIELANAYSICRQTHCIS